MIDDPRFRTNTDRVRNIDECDGAVAAFIAARTLDENMAVFQAAEVTANPVYEIDQLIADEHIQARGVIVEAPDDEAGSVLMHNVIPRLSETPGKLRHPAPHWVSTRGRCSERSAIRLSASLHWPRTA